MKARGVITVRANRVDVCDVIDEISFAKVNRDLAIETGLLEDTSGLPLVDTVYSVHRGDLGAHVGS